MLNNCFILCKLYSYSLILIVVVEKCRNLKFNFTDSDLNLFELNIVILSARENFDKRQIIRDTWLKHVVLFNELSLKHSLNFEIKAHFVLGDRSCNIHPLNRLEIYQCQPKNITEKEFNYFKTNYEPKWLIKTTEGITSERGFTSIKFYNGFSFKANQNFVLNKIGVLSKLIDQFGKVDIFLLNAYSKDLLFKDTLTSQSLHNQYFHYNDVKILIEKDSTYILTINQDLDLNMLDLELNLQYDYTNFIFRILRSYYGMHDHLSNLFRKESDLLVVNFEYELTDNISDILENGKILSNYWTKIVKSTGEKVSAESKLFGDIVFVDMIDVYRNLADKVLLYLQTYIKQCKSITHILKTDDDSYLDIFNIVRLLLSHHNAQRSWFGKKDWLVNYYGKWTDDAFTASVYPQFACGSGYVLTRHLVDWLILNSDHLHRYQGEDVSLGIWLSSINPNIIEDKRWICGNEDTFGKNNILSVPQVTPETMFELYNLSNKIIGL